MRSRGFGGWWALGLVPAAIAALGTTACVETATYEKTALERDQAQQEIAQREQRMRQIEQQLAASEQQRRQDMERVEALQREVLEAIREQKAAAASCAKAVDALTREAERNEPPISTIAALPPRRPFVAPPPRAKDRARMRTPPDLVDPWADRPSQDSAGNRLGF